MSLLSFFFLRIAFFSLPLHSSPASLGAAILFIVIGILTYFISINITLAAIFVTLVYIRGILILFSYFFSLIQNVKIYFTPLIITGGFSLVFLLAVFYQYFYSFLGKTVYLSPHSNQSSFIWVLLDTKLVIFLIFILLLRILFIEKVIGLKQKPLRVK